MIDIESKRDWTESLALGHFRVFERKQQVEHGFFVPDESTDDQVAELERQLNQRTDVESSVTDPIRVMRRETFVREIFFPVVHKQKGRLIGFDLPYLISRLAVRWSVARVKPYAGGFSFVLLEYVDESGERKDNAWYPRVAVNSIDSKRALIGFTSNWVKKPEARSTNRQIPFTSHRGKFLDARVLTYALTGESHSLTDACKAFKVDVNESFNSENEASLEEKAAVLQSRTGAVQRLSVKLVQEFALHPIALPPESAFSPASIAKGYLRAMGVTVPQIDIDSSLGLSKQEVLGAAMASYIGGRTEVKIRKTLVPCVYCDFVSMYPTVNSRMGLWELLTAETLIVCDATEGTMDLLSSIEQADCFRPKIWTQLQVLVQVVPDGDILPVRVKYGRGKNSGFAIGVNHVTSSTPMWFTLADVFAAKILTGKVPRIVRAIRFEASKKQTDLKPVHFRGSIPIDPGKDDFFKKIVEERRRVETESEMDQGQAMVLASFLKTLDNAGSYGIFVELNRQENEGTDVDVFGLESFRCRVNHVEMPGEFFFPIMGTLITGAARLMLALVESEVRRRGGEYAFMDTDSIAIVSSEEGGLIPCTGGSLRSNTERESIQALSWEVVDEILDRLTALNPYDPLLVPGSILRLEDENFRAGGASQRERNQLWCYAISSKRYALMIVDHEEAGLRKYSEHGLGNYLPPVDPSSEDQIPGWIEEVWKELLKDGFPSLAGSNLTWGNQVVRTLLRISTPEMMGWFDSFNEGQRKYSQSMKPFNSFEHAPLDAMFGRPRTGKKKICLVSPATRLPLNSRIWINIHAPAEKAIRLVPPDRHTRTPDVYFGLPYSDLILGYAHTPEPKSLGQDGRPCHQRTRGILSRRYLEIADIVHIGKEANDLELVQAGLVTDEDSVLSIYLPDPWEIVQKVLAEIPAERICREIGCSLRFTQYLRAGNRRPSIDRFPIFLGLAAKFAREALQSAGIVQRPSDDVVAVRLYVRCRALGQLWSPREFVRQ